MFEHRTEAFGQFERHILEDSQTGYRLDFVPDYGACILDVQLEHVSILDGYTTPIELDLNRWGKSGLLFPFPNRLKEGRYTWNGKTYQFPINDPTTGNALHGFGMDKPFRLLRIQAEEDTGRVALQYEYEGQFEAYPFSFTLQMDYILSLQQGLIIEYRCWNTDAQTIPWGFGWHPYFCVSENIDNCRLQTPPLMMIGVDENMIPTGKQYEYFDFVSEKRIGATVLDNCFIPADPAEERLVIKLIGERGTLSYWQEDLPYVQLFTHPDRSSLAIEPMTCNVNAFNNLNGLIRMEAGDQVKGRFGLQWNG